MDPVLNGPKYQIERKGRAGTQRKNVQLSEPFVWYSVCSCKGLQLSVFNEVEGESGYSIKDFP